MAIIIDGKLVSNTIREEIRDEVSSLKTEFGITPGLAVVFVGDDPASAVYVRNKHKACLDVGIESYVITMPADTAEEVLLNKIDELNADKRVNGILVQLPLPEHICESNIINIILFSPFN